MTAIRDRVKERAVSLCRAAGIEPDEMVGYSDQGMEGRTAIVPRWAVLFGAQAEYEIATEMGLMRHQLYGKHGGYKDAS